MLKSLFIKNYALIDELRLDFKTDFSVITGETGAGKSILLGALGLMLGERADMSALRNKSEKCVVEGVFNIENYGLQYFFNEIDLEYDSETIIRREISVTGKSRAFINDTPVNLNQLRELTLRLVDVHSQDDALLLAKNNYHADLLDIFAGNGLILSQYKKLYREYITLSKHLENVKINASKIAEELEFKKFRFSKLDDALISVDEFIELSEEEQKMTHLEEILAGLAMVSHLLENENSNIPGKIKEAANILDKISLYYSGAQELKERLNSVYIEISDILSETAFKASRLDTDPERLEFVRSRLNTYNELFYFHKTDEVSQLIQIRESLKSEISEFESSGYDIEQLETKLKNLNAQLVLKGKELTNARLTSKNKLEIEICGVLKYLGMENSVVIFDIVPLEEASSNGFEKVRILFSANKGVEPAELTKIASGGEKSRLMLALKKIEAINKGLPTVVYDEIDTGVSGAIANNMGKIMSEMSSSMQVITITHLPQVASRGNHHYKVAKFEKDNITYTSVKILEENERILEIASMLSGNTPDNAAINNAKSLLGQKN